MILLFTTDFAGFWFYLGNRYSCLAGCEYNTYSGVDTVAMIIGAVLLILQLFIAINAILPTPFLKNLPGMKLIMLLGVVTIIMMIVGIVAFGVEYSVVEWWPETAFYGGLIAGVLNTILAVLSSRKK